jgi:hypothetical protein
MNGTESLGFIPPIIENLLKTTGMLRILQTAGIVDQQYMKKILGATMPGDIHQAVDTGNRYVILSPLQGIPRDLNRITPLTG